MTDYRMQTEEGHALAVILMLVGEKGRDLFRARLFERTDDDARRALNTMNDFERLVDAMHRAKAEGRMDL